MDTGIYAIKNKINGKVYIGSTKSFKTRFKEHKHKLRKNFHGNAKLQHSWNKYGENNFEFNKVLICSKEDLLMYEQRIIDGYDAVKTGYNILTIAGSSAGIVMSEETKIKISKANKGRVFSEEHKINISISRNGMRLSDEHKRKIGESGKGRKGKKQTEESKIKSLKTILTKSLKSLNEYINCRDNYDSEYTLD